MQKRGWAKGALGSGVGGARSRAARERVGDGWGEGGRARERRGLDRREKEWAWARRSECLKAGRRRGVETEREAQRGLRREGRGVQLRKRMSWNSNDTALVQHSDDGGASRSCETHSIHVLFH